MPIPGALPCPSKVCVKERAWSDLTPPSYRALEALRAESLQLSQQSQSMREQLAATRPTRHSQERARLEEENQRLRQALLLALQGLAEDEEEEPIEEEREGGQGEGHSALREEEESKEGNTSVTRAPMLE